MYRKSFSYKEVWAEEYYNAIDDGSTVEEATKIADTAALNYVEDLFDAAEYALDR